MEAPVRKLREKFVNENRLIELFSRKVTTEDVISKLVEENKINKMNRNFNKVYEEILAQKMKEETNKYIDNKKLTINPLTKKPTIIKN